MRDLNLYFRKGQSPLLTHSVLQAFSLLPPVWRARMRPFWVVRFVWLCGLLCLATPGGLAFGQPDASSSSWQEGLAFEVWFDSEHVNAPLVTGRVDVLFGTPSELAVVVTNDPGPGYRILDYFDNVRSTNGRPDHDRISELQSGMRRDFEAVPHLPSATNWIPFETNLVVDLGPEPGWRRIWIGLRQAGAAANPVWLSCYIRLETATPEVVIRGPLSGIVSVPFLQIKGYSPKRIENIRYDLVNAEQTVTDERVYSLARDFNYSEAGFDATSFHCLDVPLVEGTNWFTLKFQDLAGNTGQTNLVYVLDITEDTTPPVASVFWPANGATVCGDNLTLRGRMDDETAEVTCRVINRAGTNAYTGLVERTGMYWVADMAMAPGTNQLQVTFKDYAWNESFTNLWVVKGDLRITVDEVPAEALQEWDCAVTGTVSDSRCAVWVNSVPAEVRPDGSWRAENVALNSPGTATFDVCAYPPGAPLPPVGEEEAVPAMTQGLCGSASFDRPSHSDGWGWGDPDPLEPGPRMCLEIVESGGKAFPGRQFLMRLSHPLGVESSVPSPRPQPVEYGPFGPCGSDGDLWTVMHGGQAYDVTPWRRGVLVSSQPKSRMRPLSEGAN